MDITRDQVLDALLSSPGWINITEGLSDERWRLEERRSTPTHAREYGWWGESTYVRRTWIQLGDRDARVTEALTPWIETAGYDTSFQGALDVVMDEYWEGGE
jgi:hypothetical protein